MIKNKTREICKHFIKELDERMQVKLEKIELQLTQIKRMIDKIKENESGL